MKKHEIKKTIEQVIGVHYIAEDGTIFYDEVECLAYEKSALFAVSSKLKRLSAAGTSQYDLNDECSEEYKLEIFDVQTEGDLEYLRRYLYLTLLQHGVNEKDIKHCFTSEDGSRKDFVFDGVTYGHEVMIFWSYEDDWFWVYKDGSLDGYFSYLRDKYNKIIAPKEENK